MQCRMEQVFPLSDFVLLARFYSEEYDYGMASGPVWYVYDIKPLAQSYYAFRELTMNPGQFALPRIQKSGAAVSWGGDTELMAEEIMLNGSPVDQSLLTMEPELCLEASAVIKEQGRQQTGEPGEVDWPD